MEPCQKSLCSLVPFSSSLYQSLHGIKRNDSTTPLAPFTSRTNAAKVKFEIDADRTIFGVA